MRIDDQITAIAYFSIPLQIVASLCCYPKLASMPWRIFILFILFALFIFLCGAGHFMRSMGISGPHFEVMNWATAFISAATALYLLPLVPSLMGQFERNMSDLELKEKVEESHRKLMTFMAFLCHEIRNPLFAITSTIDFMEDYQLTPQQERSLTNIKQSTNLMLRLVNDVLDLSRLESGKLELEEINFDIREMMQNLAAITETQIQVKHHGAVQFRFQLDASVPRIVCSDSCRILQIAYNLLSNATKYTQQGQVEYLVSTIEIDQAIQDGLVKIQSPLKSTRRNSIGDTGSPDFFLRLIEAEEGTLRQPDACVLKIQVKDTGVGIPAERLEQILVPYSQAKLSDYRKHGGTGLGLSILTKLADIMRGTLQIESTEGSGSTFTVYLPIRVPSQGAECRHSCLMNVANINNPAECTGLLPSGLVPSTKISLQPPTPQNVMNVADIINSEVFTGVLPSDLVPNGDDAPPIPTTTTSKKAQITKFSFPQNENVVLTVDDNDLNLKLICRMLGHFNLEYHTASHGKEAVEIMRKSRNMTGDPEAPNYSLILMDMQMPVMDGAEAIETLRKDGLTIPIIALTANALDHHRSEALSAGATEFATKPILRDVLYEKCRHYLSNSGSLNGDPASTSLCGVYT